MYFAWTNVLVFSEYRIWIWTTMSTQSSKASKVQKLERLSYLLVVRVESCLPTLIAAEHDLYNLNAY
jgi:hypothetical protein